MALAKVLFGANEKIFFELPDSGQVLNIVLSYI
jgi:hypothetical protein